MIRMQCYEGLDEAKALYEWKYAKQLLYTQILKDKLGEVLGGADTLAAALGKLHDFGDVFFSKEFVDRVRCCRRWSRQVVACCWSTRSTSRTPNSNPCSWKSSATTRFDPRTRHRHRDRQADGDPDLQRRARSLRRLKRRCLHLHIGFPEQKLEERIVESRVPGISATLRKQIVGFINQVRALDLKKLPSVSETIDWARVLVLLQSSELDHETVKDTLNVLLKYEADIETTIPQVSSFVAKSGRQGVFG